MSPEEVLQSYAGQDIAPPRMTADEVLATARTRVRRDRILVVAAGVVTLFVLAGVAFALPSRQPDRGLPAVLPSVSATRELPPAVTRTAPPLTCTPSALPEMAGTTADAREVTAVDPSGEWMVGFSKNGLLVWHDGKVSDLAAGHGFVPTVVNAAGTIGGYVVLADRGRAAAVFRDGTLTRLPQPAGATGGEVRAVDARGNAIGSANVGAGGVALLWPAGGGMITLTAAPGMTGYPVGFGDGGAVIGAVETDNHMYTYRWKLDGTGTGAALVGPMSQPSLAAGDWATGEGAVGADRDRLKSAGPTYFPFEGSPHVRWNMRAGTADAMGDFQTLALTADGWAFGVRDDKDFRPAVWRDGTVTTLPLRNPARNDMQYGGISADGHTIVATTRAGKDGPMDITRWTC